MTNGHPGLFDPRNPYDRLPSINVDPNFECAWRKAAWQYAQKLQPTQPNLKTVYDALQLGACGSEAVRMGEEFVPAREDALRKFPLPSHSTAANTFYVATNGNDNNDGSFASPFATLPRALKASRGVVGGSGVIAMRAGTYYLDDTVQLYAVDSGLTIQV